MRPLHLLAALSLLGACTAAPAQTYNSMGQYTLPDPHLHWHMDTGYVATTGRIADALSGGWSIGGGLFWQPDFDSPFALQADLDYSRFDATRQLIGSSEAADPTQINDGFGEIVDLAIDGEYRMALSPYVTTYALAGAGVAHRRIALTQVAPFGGYVCDPWFGSCDFNLVPGEVVRASDNTTAFEWNAGLGLDFALSSRESFFVEARFTRMQTSQPTDFVPIRVGLRF